MSKVNVIVARGSNASNNEVQELIKRKELSRDDLILILNNLMVSEYNVNEKGQVAYREPYERRPSFIDYSDFRERLLKNSFLPSGIVFDER